MTHGLTTVLAIVTVLISLTEPLAAIAETVQLLHPTNTVWRYMAPTNDPGFGTDWHDPLFGDDGPEWQSGVGLFGHESLGPTYADGLRFSTPILPPGHGTPDAGPINAFFRTHFTWSGSTQNVVLIFTNYVDDGMVIFLNGTEIHRFLINGNPGDPVQFSGIPNSRQYFTEPVRTVFQIDPSKHPNDFPAQLKVGDNVIAVYVGQTSQSSADVVFGMSLHASPCSPLTVLHPPAGGTNVSVAECSSATLSIDLGGLPPSAYQWFHSGVPIESATNASLTLTGVRPGVHDGAYTAWVTNLCGAVTSPPINVVVIADTTPPVLLFAEVNAARTEISTSWSEPLAFPASGDELYFSVDDGAGAELNGFSPLALRNGTNLVITLIANVWVERGLYWIRDFGAGARDLCRNLPSAPSQTTVKEPLFFRTGLNGYAGTDDTELRGAQPATSFGNAVDLRVDTQDGVPSAPSHGLLRFDALFGSGPNQIPHLASIERAILRLTISEVGSPINVHRMLVNWDESTATWDLLFSGISNDDVEAEFLPVAALNGSSGSADIDVTESVRGWANGGANYGWALLPTGSDGVKIDSSEHANSDNRPELRVFYTHGDPCFIVREPPASIVIREGDPFTMSFELACDAGDFQWQMLSAGLWMNVPGATNPTFTRLAATLADNGHYRAFVTGPFLAVTSRVTAVTVATRSTMRITRGDNAVIVSWDPPTGTLEESSDLITWHASDNQAGGVPRPLSSARPFFRIRQ